MNVAIAGLSTWRIFDVDIAHNDRDLHGVICAKAVDQGMESMSSVESTRGLLAAAEGFLGRA